MDNVISLTGKPIEIENDTQVRDTLLEFLDEARKAVEAGDIESITGIMLHKTADMSYFCIGMTSVPTVIGCLEFAKVRLMGGE